MHERRVGGERHVAALDELDDLVLLAVILQLHVLRVEVEGGVGVVVEVHVHLVAHPRKGQDETRGPGKLDVAGSSKITDGADNVFTVWSARKDENSAENDPDKPDAKLELQKQRNGDVQHYSQYLWFNKAAQQFATNSRRAAVEYVTYSNQSTSAYA